MVFMLANTFLWKLKLLKTKTFNTIPLVKLKQDGTRARKTLFHLLNIYLERFLLPIRILKTALHWWKRNCLPWKQ